MTCLFFISNNDNAKFNAAVPLFTAIQSSEFVYFWKFSSNFLTFPFPAPEAQFPLRRTSKIFSSSKRSITGSNNLIFLFIIHFDFLYF